MQESEFKRWLYTGPWSDKSIASRISLVRRIEKAQVTYDLADVDLDTAYKADEFDDLFRLLSDLLEDAKGGGEKFRKLLPKTNNPESKLRQFKLFLEQYGTFLDGSEAWPALARLKSTYLRRCHDFVDFEQKNGTYWEIEREYKDQIISAVQNIVASDSTNTAVGEAILDILTLGKGIKTNGGLPLGWQSLDKIKKSNPEHRDAFFKAMGQLSRTKVNRIDAVDDAASKLIKLKTDGLTVLSKGVILSTILCVIACIRPKEACFAKTNIVNKLGTALYEAPFFTGRDFNIGEVEKFLSCIERVFAVMEKEWHWKPLDLFDVQGFVWVALNGKWEMDDSNNPKLTKEAVRAAMAECDELGEKLFLKTYKFGPSRRYRVRERDGHIDYPSKAIASVAFKYTDYSEVYRLNGGITQPQDAGSRLDKLRFKIIDLQKKENSHMAKISKHPLNQILYGPPGTGKTYTTAKIAVEICDGHAPQERGALMDRYNDLVESNRIAFTTFHQSMGYEEFIEGLRPVTDNDEDGESGSTGFRLEPKKGIFREICTLAKEAPVKSGDGSDYDFTGKSFFKMSLGRAKSESFIYNACLEQNCIVLGYGGEIDWSEPKYEAYDAVKEKWQSIEPDASGNNGNISQVWTFRGRMKKGDIVVVSDGNLRFRAIGEIIGDYEYSPPSENDGDFISGKDFYSHRRQVKWLKVLDESLPAEVILTTRFSQASCYHIERGKIKLEALSEFVTSERSLKAKTGAVDNYVLIMDEINRANISKIFGELITLIEPDKRIGLGAGENALQVTLPYSNDTFGVPKNLYLIGTMNTADRSIALLDTALRRRFNFQEMMPLYDLKRIDRKVDGVHLGDFLSAVNKRIEWLFDRDHQIGHSFLMDVESRNDLDKVVREKIIPLLVEYFYEDWNKVIIALNDKENHFIKAKTLKVPQILNGNGEDRLQYSVNTGSIPLNAYEAASEQ